MKVPRFKIALALAALCLMFASAYLICNRDPCARVKRMARNAGRLSASSQVYRWQDYVVHALQGQNAFMYYSDEIHKEEQRLLAAGYFVQTKIRIPPDRSEREVQKALYTVYQRTDFYCDASVDVTNHDVLLLSRPEDIATFSAALK
jgi:hypothetical protein